MSLYFFKGKLENHLKKYLYDNISNTIYFENFINELKLKYIDNIDFLDRFLQILQELCFNKNVDIDIFIRNLCIYNLNNENLIKELLNFVDMSRNYEFEQKIEELKKDILELKKDVLELNNITKEQSIKINEMSEN